MLNRSFRPVAARALVVVCCVAPAAAAVTPASALPRIAASSRISARPHPTVRVVHRAGIGSDGPSRGVLERSQHRISIATFRDCAAYNLRTVQDAAAIHTCDGSRYASSSTGSP